MSKKLNTDQIRSELEGSAFFPKDKRREADQPSQKEVAPEVADEQASIDASMLASKQERPVPTLLSPTMLTAIRKMVRIPGREVSFVRLSKEEKDRLADIVYTYKRQGQKTSENEINRIAVNFMLEDYREHGEQSILAKALAALQD